MWWLILFFSLPTAVFAVLLLARKAARRRRRSAVWEDLGQRGKLISAQLVQLRQISDQKEQPAETDI